MKNADRQKLPIYIYIDKTNIYGKTIDYLYFYTER